MHKVFIKNIFNAFAGCTLVFMLFQSSAFSQDFTASAKADTNVITIGMQTRLTLSVEHTKQHRIQWITVPDTMGKIEVIEKSAIDTSYSADSSAIIQKQHIIITSFDSGYHVIPEFRFVDAANPDTNTNFTETEPLLLTVNTIPVDTTQAIKDIKAPVKVRFSFIDALPYLIALILIALIIITSIYFYKKFKKRPVVEVIKKPSRPPHETALEELARLENEKLWQQGSYKLYYTRLTDIVRSYMQERYSVNAPEMTTDEILRYHFIPSIERSAYLLLKYMLELADLVKFAKIIPLAGENEQCMSNARNFIIATQNTVVVTEDKKETSQ